MNTDINQLLERYWRCETSVEEEQYLRDWFSKNDIPEEFAEYRAIFSFQNILSEQKASPLVAQSVLSVIHQDMQEAHSPIIRFYPFLKIAASVLVVISIGIGFYTHYQQEKFLQETFSETYSNPEDALEETRAALGKVSSSLSMAQDIIEQLQPDSVPDETVKKLNQEESK